MWNGIVCRGRGVDRRIVGGAEVQREEFRVQTECGLIITL
jgi:hypothetical protein